jgi:hypothetical protein
LLGQPVRWLSLAAAAESSRSRHRTARLENIRYSSPTLTARLLLHFAARLLTEQHRSDVRRLPAGKSGRFRRSCTRPAAAEADSCVDLTAAVLRRRRASSRAVNRPVRYPAEAGYLHKTIWVNISFASDIAVCRCGPSIRAGHIGRRPAERGWYVAAAEAAYAAAEARRGVDVRRSRNGFNGYRDRLRISREESRCAVDPNHHDSSRKFTYLNKSPGW